MVTHSHLGLSKWCGLALLIVLIALCKTSLAASVSRGITLSADSENIYLGDIVIIEMRSVGLLDSADVSALFTQADLLRETTGTQIAVIDGRVVEVNIRRMEFEPRIEGTIRFGPAQGETKDGLVSSNTLSINVLPAIVEPWIPDEDDLHVTISMHTDNNTYTSNELSTMPTTYVGQKITVDIALRHRDTIADETVRLPSFDGFDVLTEFAERRTNEPDDSAFSMQARSTHGLKSNEADWRVVQWRYHLFAQRSGPMSIDAVHWSGTLIRSRTQRAQFEKMAEPRQLQIKPAAYTSQWWLPADEVSLSETWSRDPRELTAGDELIRTITLNATNVLASHLPVVTPLESRAISSTLLDQQREQKLIGDTIQSTAQFRYRLVAQSPIPVFLDTVRVSWYDPNTSESYEAIIPARRINVGLPDRADLLAEIALNERWQDKAALHIRTLATGFAYWHISLAILSLVALGMLLQFIGQRFRANATKQLARGTSALPEL